MSEGEQIARRSFVVYIIESPSPVDLYKKRYEGDILQKALLLAEIPAIHRLAVNSEALRAALTVGLQEILSQENPIPPIIHISSHGNADGVQLTSGEIIGWGELKKLLVPINKTLKGKLLLCMSSCEGFGASKMAMTQDDELPYFGVIGNCDKPTWSDTAIAFTTFYHLLAKGNAVPQAVAAMKTSSGNENFREILASEAKQIFLAEVGKLHNQHLSEEFNQNISSVSENQLSKALKEDKGEGYTSATILKTEDMGRR